MEILSWSIFLIIRIYFTALVTLPCKIFNHLAAGREKGSGFWAVYFKLDK